MSRLSNELLYVDDKYGDQDGDDGSSMLQMQRVVAQKKVEAPAKRKGILLLPSRVKGLSLPPISLERFRIPAPGPVCMVGQCLLDSSPVDCRLSCG